MKGKKKLNTGGAVGTMPNPATSANPAEGGKDPFSQFVKPLEDVTKGIINKSSTSLYGGIGQGIGQALNLVLPGIGTLAAPILGAIGSKIGMNDDMAKAMNKDYANTNNTVNPYQLEMGGMIGDDDSAQYKGKTHSEGGIDVDSNGLPVANSSVEVEDGETMVELKVGGKKINYVFSNKLKI